MYMGYTYMVGRALKQVLGSALKGCILLPAAAVVAWASHSHELRGRGTPQNEWFIMENPV